jgi:membrane associated rhomboid family serine protease
VIAAIHAVGQHHEGFSVEFAGRSLVVPDLRWSEPQRMVAANFFHSSNLHLANNLSGLLLTGWLIESALGRAVILNVALWGGMCGMYNGLRLNQDHGLATGLGASAMVYALGGAFLTWRALMPALFGPLGRNSLLWVVLLLYAAFALAGDEPALTPFHLGGFVYGVASGLLGLRLSPPWRRRFAVLALGLCVASAAVIGMRALRQEPFETTEAMRVLLDGPHPGDYVNRISWYWATQPDAPRALLGIARERMEGVVAEKASLDYQDTLATLHYRLGDLGRAVELERAALESELPPEKIPFLVSQLARFEYAWLSHEDAASLERTRFACGASATGCGNSSR